MVRLGKIKSVRGSVFLPGDKSIAHRALIHSALSMSDCEISNLPESLDVLTTLNALRKLQVPIYKIVDGEYKIKGGGGELAPSDDPIDCNNSGTTMRLLMGVLASCPFESVLIGDQSLSRRPMERIAQPLRMMGAEIVTTDGHAPVRIVGRRDLKQIEYIIPIPSAQVKSGIIYAARSAIGESVITEPIQTRDHTERAFEKICPSGYFREIYTDRIVHRIKGPCDIDGFTTTIPSDLSSSGYLIALALLMPDSEIVFHNLLLNPTRIRYLEILQSMGADISIEQTGMELNEPIGTVIAKSSELKNIEIQKEDIPLIIDEIPLLGMIASKADGVFTIGGASELRFKESDRIKSLVENLKRMNVDVSESEDGFTVSGKQSPVASEINHHNDHRILMSLIVFSVIHGLDIEFPDLNPLEVSFPEFMQYIQLLST
jgi:3-phosphoshikimate 1-carboxyvinyltransferase